MDRMSRRTQRCRYLTFLAIALVLGLIFLTAGYSTFIRLEPEVPRYHFTPALKQYNTAVVTAFTAGRPWVPYSTAIQAGYCQRQHLDCYAIDLSLAPLPPLHGRCTGLIKFAIINELLTRGYERVFWMDDDAFFVNLSRPLFWLEILGQDQELIIARDMSLKGYSSINDGVMLWKNTPWARYVLRLVWSAYNHPYWRMRSSVATWTHSCDQTILEQLVVLKDIPNARSQAAQLTAGTALIGSHVAITDHMQWNQWFGSAGFIRHLAGTQDATERRDVIAAAAKELGLA